MTVNFFIIDNYTFWYTFALSNKKIVVMTQTTIKYLSKGEFFRFKDDENAPLWVRSEYSRIDKKYECYKYDDINHRLFCKSDRKVWI